MRMKKGNEIGILTEKMKMRNCLMEFFFFYVCGSCAFSFWRISLFPFPLFSQAVS
jgi:DNA-binding transcriptional regulator of glucitol operon